MGQVIDIGMKLKQRKISYAEDLSKKYGKAEEILGEYLLIAMTDPNNAIDELSKFLNKVRNIKHSSFPSGPNKEWTGALLDVVGMLYPMLNKSTRKKGLLNCLDFLDSQDNNNSQEQISYIDEPWLVADIIINRPAYEHSSKEYSYLISRYIEWDNLVSEMGEIKSEFFFALAVMHPEYSSLNIRANYYKKFPEIKDRTEDAVAAFIATNAEIGLKDDSIPIEETIDIELLRYDPLLHDNIRRKIKEDKWVKL